VVEIVFRRVVAIDSARPSSFRHLLVLFEAIRRWSEIVWLVRLESLADPSARVRLLILLDPFARVIGLVSSARVALCVICFVGSELWRVPLSGIWGSGALRPLGERALGGEGHVDGCEVWFGAVDALREVLEPVDVRLPIFWLGRVDVGFLASAGERHIRAFARRVLGDDQVRGVGRLALGRERVLDVGEPEIGIGDLLLVELEENSVGQLQHELTGPRVDLRDLGAGAVA
jgi:hypothetical protein